MELQTIKEKKMLACAIYAVDTYGTTDGVTKYNSCMTDLCACKKLTLEQLKTNIDNT